MEASGLWHFDLDLVFFTLCGSRGKTATRIGGTNDIACVHSHSTAVLHRAMTWVITLVYLDRFQTTFFVTKATLFIKNDLVHVESSQMFNGYHYNLYNYSPY